MMGLASQDPPFSFLFGMSNFDWPITKKELIKKKSFRSFPK
jgi:hypothetical protein